MPKYERIILDFVTYRISAISYSAKLTALLSPAAFIYTASFCVGSYAEFEGAIVACSSAHPSGALPSNKTLAVSPQ
jgi:hypothetical protein